MVTLRLIRLRKWLVSPVEGTGVTFDKMGACKVPKISTQCDNKGPEQYIFLIALGPCGA